jgi:hypothetical protein
MPIQEGGRYEVQLYFTDREDDDSAIDLSDSDLAMEWYSEACTSPIILTSGDGLTLTDAASGYVIVYLTPAQTLELGPGEARCILYQDYNDTAQKAWLLEGSEIVEAKAFDA